jgi:mRNA-degrading endonuclease RelE of RelBE toxin-antitoxin system
VAYRIDFTPEAADQIAGLRAHQRARLLDMIERQLVSQPMIETRNRRPLRPNPVAEYRLRVGALRVYYDVRGEPERLVIVKAVGVKVRDRVSVGGIEVKL